MNISIKEVLKPIGIPVSNHTIDPYKRANPTISLDSYIIYFEYNQNGALHADDEEISTRLSYQVDVFTKGDLTALVQQVKSLLKQAGFSRIYENEIYEEEMGYFRRIMRYSYVMKGE